MITTDSVITGDCIEILKSPEMPKADLIFADPPFNIGYKYDVYEDRKAYDDYFAWTEKWMTACKEALADTGSFWIAIGDDFAAEVRMLGRKLGLNLRNWVIWHYTFGQNTQKKFARSHTHLFYFTNHSTDFYFDDTSVRVFSDRQRWYKDKRANEHGKMPDDVWDEFPRVCGTFEEREGWHPCQMPETILARIIRSCSKRDDVVLDPFAGSGTTLVVAKKLSRNYLGFELSKKYVAKMKKRLSSVHPLSSLEIQIGRQGPWPKGHIKELQGLYIESGIPTEQLFKNSDLKSSFTNKLNLRLGQAGGINEYVVDEVQIQLERLRKAGKLGKLRVHFMEPTNDRPMPLLEGVNAND